MSSVVGQPRGGASISSGGASPGAGLGRLAAPAVMLRRLWPGLVLVAVLSLAAQALAALQEATVGRLWIEGLVLALLLGVVVRHLRHDLGRCEAGAAYAGKQVLELAVVLLGAGINVGPLLATGPRLIVLIVAGVTSVLVLGFVVGRLVGLGPRLAFLVATGNAICGNSAIAAVAPIIKAERSEITSAIALTAILGVTLVIALPVLIPLAGLSLYQFGVVAGMGVYAVPQVLAAAFSVSELSGDVATAVKLGRVMLLGPLVLVVGLVMAATRQQSPGAPTRLAAGLPWFVIGFLVLAALRIVGLLPDAVAQPTRALGSALTVLAMAGLGLGVNVAAVRAVGVRVAVAVVLSLGILIGMTLVLLRVLGIDG